MAVLRRIRTSPQKLNLVAAMIRGQRASDALDMLMFSKKRVAADVRGCLMSAVANAENNHQLDVDDLYVTEAYVGKDVLLRRGRPRGRGRFGPIRKQFSRLTIVVREVME